MQRVNYSSLSQHIFCETYRTSREVYRYEYEWRADGGCWRRGLYYGADGGCWRRGLYYEILADWQISS